jgi:hypothetical protein
MLRETWYLVLALAGVAVLIALASRQCAPPVTAQSVPTAWAVHVVEATR